jgi:hypothetical protein
MAMLLTPSASIVLFFNDRPIIKPFREAAKNAPPHVRAMRQLPQSLIRYGEKG